MSLLNDLLYILGEIWKGIMSAFRVIWKALERALINILSKMPESARIFINELICAFLDDLTIRNPVWGNALKVIYVKIRRSARLWIFDKKVEVVITAGGNHTREATTKITTIPWQDLTPEIQKAMTQTKEVEVTSPLQ